MKTVARVVFNLRNNQYKDAHKAYRIASKLHWKNEITDDELVTIKLAYHSAEQKLDSAYTTLAKELLDSIESLSPIRSTKV